MKNNYRIGLFGLIFSCIILTLGSEPDKDAFVCPSTHEWLSENQLIERVDHYFHRQIPGLDVSYQAVLDAFAAEGVDIYIKGGVLRDLFSCPIEEPNDIDFTFSGSASIIKTILDQHGWVKYHISERGNISIGNVEGHPLEGVPLKDHDIFDKNALEFTANNIFFHWNTKSFVENSHLAIHDAMMKHLRSSSEDWEAWLSGDGDNTYNKIFRYWKMRGKGYTSSTEFDKFIREKTIEIAKKDMANFKKELIRNLAGHIKSFDSIGEGCTLSMSKEWCEVNVYQLEDIVILKHVEKRLHDYKSLQYCQAEKN